MLWIAASGLGQARRSALACLRGALAGAGTAVGASARSHVACGPSAAAGQACCFTEVAEALERQVEAEAKAKMDAAVVHRQKAEAAVRRNAGAQTAAGVSLRKSWQHIVSAAIREEFRLVRRWGRSALRVGEEAGASGR